MSMFVGGYSAALTSVSSASDVGANRPTTTTVNANNTAAMGGSLHNIVYYAAATLIIAAALLVLGRFIFADVRIA